MHYSTAKGLFLHSPHENYWYTIRILLKARPRFIARPIGQGPCDQRRESCLSWENSFGPKMTVILKPSGIDKDHGRQFYTVAYHP